MESMKQMLGKKVAAINQDPGKMEKVREWINGYRGKVISLQADDEIYHVIFQKEKVLLRDGHYSSCEFSYIGSRDVLVRVIQGKESATTAGMTGRIKGWGSLNEALQFEKLLA